MKKKTFFKRAVKYWLVENLVLFITTIVVVFFMGYASHIMGWDMGFMALAFMTWKEIKGIWKDGEKENG